MARVERRRALGSTLGGGRHGRRQHRRGRVEDAARHLALRQALTHGDVLAQTVGLRCRAGGWRAHDQQRRPGEMGRTRQERAAVAAAHGSRAGV
eukprot:5761508-Prymnesium_polylepis.1